MKENWFQKLVADELKRRGWGGARKLAEALHIDQSQITKWSSGSEPSIYNAAAFLKLIGGDIERAKPDWQLAEVPSMHIFGQVQAGAVEEGGQFEREIPGLSDEAWKGSSLYKKTTGRTILLEVIGDSMEPGYYEGELIVCREPAQPKEIPDGTPCVFREGRGYTFKLLRWTKDKKDVVGVPINPMHKPIVFERTEDMRIKYAVLGKIDIGKKQR